MHRLYTDKYNAHAFITRGCGYETSASLSFSHVTYHRRRREFSPKFTNAMFSTKPQTLYTILYIYVKSLPHTSVHAPTICSVTCWASKNYYEIILTRVVRNIQWRALERLLETQFVRVRFFLFFNSRISFFQFDFWIQADLWEIFIWMITYYELIEEVRLISWDLERTRLKNRFKRFSDFCPIFTIFIVVVFNVQHVEKERMRLSITRESIVPIVRHCYFRFYRKLKLSRTYARAIHNVTSSHFRRFTDIFRIRQLLLR